MKTRRAFRIRRLATTAALTALSTCAGCSSLALGGRGETSFVFDSRVLAAQYRPTFRTSVYAYRDPNTADVVLSEWSEAELRAFAETGRITPGSMLHVHYFLTPAAGRTPVDFTANNCTFSYLVVADERGSIVGRYGGGGFALPSRSPGRATFSASIRGGTLRPLEATERFNDAIASAEVSGAISARRDDSATDAMLDWMVEMERTRLRSGMD